jgi:mannose-1-phosphate guanylyltransferase
MEDLNVTFTSKESRNKDLWSLVLAGGSGERLKPMIQKWLGRDRPKQYCVFVGTRSMFEHPGSF